MHESYSGALTLSLPVRTGHPALRYFPTPFTEHFPVVHDAKHGRGLKVIMARDVEALHAFLPK